MYFVICLAATNYSITQSGSKSNRNCTERSICYRKSVLQLLKHMFHVHLKRCSTDLRSYTIHPVVLLLPDLFLLESCLLKKSWLISYNKLQYEMGQDYLVIQYSIMLQKICYFLYAFTFKLLHCNAERVM